ncbi:MAG: agmatine deiminase family protein [Bacteroidales bacterium]|nr:agmatine deiminase family protein [Candidatus Physcousia equi]
MALTFHRNTLSIDDLTLQINFNAKGVEDMEQRSTHLPAEWFPQSGVQLTWPHEQTDWAPMLDEVTDTYLRMALEIALQERLIIATPHPAEVEALLHQRLPERAWRNISLHEAPTNDTWARDHGALTLIGDTEPRLLDFQFNGWGKKFEAEKDNALTRALYNIGIIHGQYESHLDFVLEGGSIESDGHGTLMTTSQCLLAPNRNQPLSRADIEERLCRWLHAERVLWIDHGYLAGDDTDSHVDTLARFCPSDTIAYVQCTDPNDEHFEALQLMEQQLRSFRTLNDEPYRLVPLPMAPARYDEGDRLPSTYANFLFINDRVLMPTYGDRDLDEQARRQLAKACPHHDIVGIDCQSLIRQHGSLHCCTMQFPLGVIL